MPDFSLDARRRTHFELNTRLGRLDNGQLLALVGRDDRPFWETKRNRVVRLGRRRVFVKRVPVTRTEYDRWMSTANHYRLPTCNNYGVGSAGFGVWRELAAHISSTNWVLDGQTEHFPLLYHWRVLPYAGAHSPIPADELRAYVRNWNGSRRIGRYVRDKAAAPYEALLFLEHLPHTLGPWIDRHMDGLEDVHDQVRGTLDFLRRQGVVHFDCHYLNILSDGRRAYLTDFGLVLDRAFALGADEVALFKANRFYDYGLFLACLSLTLQRRYNALGPARRARLLRYCGMGEAVRDLHIRVALVEYRDALQRSGLFPLEANFKAALDRYYPVVRLMQDFLIGLARNRRKDTAYSQARLRRLLKQTGFVPA